MKILHITTHMGGGAGNAISDMIKENAQNQHSLVTLQSCEKKTYIEKCIKHGTVVFEAATKIQIENEMKEADIVLLHWWHHPLICRFLAEFPEIACRTVLWSHISGCTYPVLQEPFLNYFDFAFLTTPYSYENPQWSNDTKKKIEEKTDIVYGLGDLSSFAQKTVRQKETNRFVVGYVGTLGNAKLNVRFVDFCQEVIKKIPNVKFLMVGDTDDALWLMDEIKQKGLENYFEFTGYCTNIKEQLARMEVFAYPLNEQHFGTTENAILEAMLSELPVVLLNQNTEKYIVKHYETGMLVNNKEEYAEAIETLYNNRILRETIGIHARKAVLENYSIERNVKIFQKNMEKVVGLPKHIVRFHEVIGTQPFQWFLHGLSKEDRSYFEASMHGADKQEAIEQIINCKPILRSRSKSSVLHFANTYSEDKWLQYWKELLI